MGINSLAMKRICIHISALLGCVCLFGAYGQNSAGTNLKIELQSIQSITVNEAQSNVAIALTTASEYLNGKSSQQADHIKIMSSSNYEIKVSAATNLIGESSSIDVGTVTLVPSQGSIGGDSSNNLNMNPVALSLGDTTLVQASQGDAERSFNVDYKVSGGAAYLNKPSGTYSTLITYTILVP